MKNKEYESLADWAVRCAVNAGCQSARAELNYVQHLNVEVRNGVLETLQQSTSLGLNLRLFVDNKYGSISTNRLHQEELQKFIHDGIAQTRLLGEDSCRTLPDPNRYYHKNDMDEDLGICDDQISEMPTEEKIALITRASQYDKLQARDSRIISVEGNLQDRIGWQYISDSQGFRGLSKASVCSSYISITMQTKKDARPSDYAHETTISYSTLNTDYLAEEAYRRTLQKIGAHPIPSGIYTIIVEPRVIGKLLDPMIDVLEGAYIYQKRSFLADKKCKRIASPLLTILDIPQKKGALGACYFDYEGVATKKQTIIHKGVLQTFFLDTYYANKLDTTPTSSTPNVLCIPPGKRSCEEIIASQKCALLITGFNGGNYNEVTGDFSFGIEGMLINDGVMTTPVAEMNITGNLLQLWNGLVEIGNETRQVSAGFIPTLVFDGVTCNGE